MNALKREPAAAAQRRQRMQRLIERLPRRMQGPVHWLLKPSSRWLRLPAGVLLCLGGCLAILPVLGLWMLPLGLLLLAEDIAPLARLSDRMLDWVARRRPEWFAPPPDNGD